MSFFGRSKPPQGQLPEAASADEQAISRYQSRRMGGVAQPTPEQRRMVLQNITENVPASERALAASFFPVIGMARTASMGLRNRVKTPDSLTPIKRSVTLTASLRVVSATHNRTA